MNLKTLEEKIKIQVQNEYQKGFDHIRPERERKRNAINSVLNTDGEIRSHLLWQNIQLEKALFLTDEIGIKLLSDNGVLGEKIMENAEKVLRYDDLDMCLREQRETIVDQNGLYGLSATVIDAWDDFEKQPIGDVLDPLAIIIDPQNYTGSKMRFFGVERRVSRNWLETTDGFENVKDIGFSKSSELDQTKRVNDSANNLQTIVEDEGMCDIYDHFTIYDGSKWLTTWANERNMLIRAIELEPLTEAERRKPTKVKFPIQLHRRKPKYGSVFGASIYDEVIAEQDAISILKRLQLLQANMLALGPDTFADSRLGIDTELLSQSKIGGRIIDVTNDSGMPTQNLLYTHQLPAPNPFIEQQIAALENSARQTTNISSQSFGVSQSGTQTKAEIQTLQQNQNQILIMISNNYLEGQKRYYEDHYRSYALNMSKGKKNISIMQKGNSLSLSLSKEDFIADGKVSVYITSKSQDTIENDKEFNKLIVLSETYLANMKEGYSKNDFLRMFGRKSNIRDFDEYRYISKTVDEMDAMNQLNLINKDIEVPGPEDGQDYMTYILIYRQGLETKARDKALAQYEEAYMKFQKPLEQAMMPQGGGNPTASGIAMNQLSQTANASPSTAIATL